MVSACDLTVILAFQRPRPRAAMEGAVDTPRKDECEEVAEAAIEVAAPVTRRAGGTTARPPPVNLRPTPVNPRPTTASEGEAAASEAFRTDGRLDLSRGRGPLRPRLPGVGKAAPWQTIRRAKVSSQRQLR